MMTISGVNTVPLARLIRFGVIRKTLLIGSLLLVSFANIRIIIENRKKLGENILSFHIINGIFDGGFK